MFGVFKQEHLIHSKMTLRRVFTSAGYYNFTAIDPSH